MAVKQFLLNLVGQEPFLAKARLVVKNNLIKATRLQGCCGNHGQAGC